MICGGTVCCQIKFNGKYFSLSGNAKVKAWSRAYMTNDKGFRHATVKYKWFTRDSGNCPFPRGSVLH